MRRPALAPTLGQVLTLLLLATAPAPVQAQPASDGDGAPPVAPGGMFRASTLSLSAYGEVKAAPDMAGISLGVQTLAPTASEAMSQNAAQMDRIVAALKRAGIAAKDIQTSGLNLNAQYAYEQDKPPRLTGYQAANQVTITVYDLARLGQTLDAVVAAGANQINGITFGLKDPLAAEDAARLKAVQALRAKAQLYAGATGLRLVRLINLGEGASVSQSPRPMAMYSVRKAEGRADAGRSRRARRPGGHLGALRARQIARASRPRATAPPGRRRP